MVRARTTRLRLSRNAGNAPGARRPVGRRVRRVACALLRASAAFRGGCSRGSGGAGGRFSAAGDRGCRGGRSSAGGGLDASPSRGLLFRQGGSAGSRNGSVATRAGSRSGQRGPAGVAARRGPRSAGRLPLSAMLAGSARLSPSTPIRVRAPVHAPHGHGVDECGLFVGLGSYPATAEVTSGSENWPKPPTRRSRRCASTSRRDFYRLLRGPRGATATTAPRRSGAWSSSAAAGKRG
jgi:hypothetical protein